LLRIINFQNLACLFLVLLPYLGSGQSHNHWTRSFNEESSLLSGAVVGGGAGPSAIYYNPASISEITESKLSFNVSLFTIDFQGADNVLGDDINLENSKIIIEPRFISYMIKPKKHPDWSLELAFLNNENFSVQNSQSVDQQMDVLTNLPGTERYYAFFQYSNKYRDDWIGIGGSWKLSPSIFIGASMFVSMRALEYSYILNIEAFPMDSVFVEGEYVPFYSASYREMDYLKCNDYRLLWKIGLLYKKKKYSIGINFTTPSVGNIYSDGKQSARELTQANITNPETGQPIPDIVLADYKEKKEMYVNAKSPYSLAAGVTYEVSKRDRVVYLTAEYFGGLDPYRYAQADENPNLETGSVFQQIDHSEWLTFVSGAKPVLNAAVGSRWLMKENYMILVGFRTDFNYQKNLDFNPYTENKLLKGLNLDLYHFTGGLSWRIRGQDIMLGLQYTLGREKEQKQIVNLSDPVEYNTTKHVALQGTRQNTMNSHINSLSIYFGATFNFGNSK